MKNLFVSFLIYFTLHFCNVFAQEISVHKFQNNYYKENIIQQESNNPKAETTTTKIQLNKVVFGYLPDWEYLDGTHTNIRYDLISHLAVFPFIADSSGNLSNPYNWPWNDVINSCSTAKVKLIASIGCFNGNTVHTLLNDQTKRTNLFTNIKNIMLKWGFAGVNIDFEELFNSDKPSAMGNFIKLLNQYIKAVNQSYEISTAVYPVNFDNWGYDDISEYSDLLFVMCYNYYGSWSFTSGPSSPFEGTYYNISKSFTNDLASIVAKYPQRILYGIAYVGNHWKTKTSDAYSIVDTSKANKGFVKTLKYSEIFLAYQSKEIIWDALSKTPWLRWNDDGWNQIWYDDASSLSIKYDYTLQKRFGGVGIWALGYDDGRTELWKVIEDKFAKPTNIAEREVPTQARLFQNYPNPFNPSTNISYQLSTDSHVSLKVYDLIGREVATLVNEFKTTGTFQVEFGVETPYMASLPSGVYFYTLKTGGYSETKKMTLVK